MANVSTYMFYMSGKKHPLLQIMIQIYGVKTLQVLG